MSEIKNITVKELSSILSEQKDGRRIIDVREQDEYDIARIEGTELIPLSQFIVRAPKELSTGEKIIIFCHHGGRSMQACHWLMKEGYEDLSNVVGGIEEWSVQIDPQVPRY